MGCLKNFLEKVFCGDRLKSFYEDLFFFWRALALVSLVLGLGLEHSCPWPRECLSSERLSMALASDFFCVLSLGLALEPYVLDSTSGPYKFFCVLVDSNGSLLVFIGPYSSLRILMGPHWSFLVVFRPYGFYRVLMGLFSSALVLVDSNGSLCVFMGLYGFLRSLLGFYGF